MAHECFTRIPRGQASKTNVPLCASLPFWKSAAAVNFEWLTKIAEFFREKPTVSEPYSPILSLLETLRAGGMPETVATGPRLVNERIAIRIRSSS